MGSGWCGLRQTTRRSATSFSLCGIASRRPSNDVLMLTCVSSELPAEMAHMLATTRTLTVLTTCLLAWFPPSQPAYAHSVNLAQRAMIYPPACTISCVSARGQISCPNFLTTPDHYPCVDYRMVAT